MNLYISGYFVIGKKNAGYEVIRKSGVAIDIQWKSKADAWLHTHNQNEIDSILIVYPGQHDQIWIVTSNEPGSDASGRSLSFCFVIKTTGLFSIDHLPMVYQLELTKDTHLPDSLEPSADDLSRVKKLKETPIENFNELAAKLIYGENFAVDLHDLTHLWSVYPYLIQWIGYFKHLPTALPETRGLIFPDHMLHISDDCKAFVHSFSCFFQQSDPQLNTLFKTLQSIDLCKDKLQFIIHDQFECLHENDYHLLRWLKRTLSKDQWLMCIQTIPVELLMKGISENLLAVEDVKLLSDLEAYFLTNSKFESLTLPSEYQLVRAKKIARYVPENKTIMLLKHLPKNANALEFWSELMMAMLDNTIEKSFLSMVFTHHNFETIPEWFQSYYAYATQLTPEKISEKEFFQFLRTIKDSNHAAFIPLCAIGLSIDKNSNDMNILNQLFIEKSLLLDAPPPKNYSRLLTYQLINETDLLSIIPFDRIFQEKTPKKISYLKQYANQSKYINALIDMMRWRDNSILLPEPPPSHQVWDGQILQIIVNKPKIFFHGILQNKNKLNQWKTWLNSYENMNKTTENLINAIQLLDNPDVVVKGTKEMVLLFKGMAKYISTRQRLGLLVSMYRKQPDLKADFSEQMYEILDYFENSDQQSYLDSMMNNYVLTCKDVGWSLSELYVLLPLLNPYDILCMLFSRPYSKDEDQSDGQQLVEKIKQLICQQFPKGPPDHRMPRPEQRAEHKGMATKIAEAPGWEHWGPDTQDVQKNN